MAAMSTPSTGTNDVNGRLRTGLWRAIWVALALLFVVSAAGFGYWLGGRHAMHGRELADRGPAPVFRSLRNQLGQRVDSSQFAGKVQVVTFLFPYCTSECPLIALHLVGLENDLRMAGLADRVQIVAFNVDPAHTGPVQASAFLREYGWNPQDLHWQFLTGTPQQTARIVREGYHVDYEQVSFAEEAADQASQRANGDYVPQPQVANPLAAKVNPDYDIAHDNMLVLVDPHGQMRWFSTDADTTSPSHLLRLIQGLLAPH